jgi:hypothetical protein
MMKQGEGAIIVRGRGIPVFRFFVSILKVMPGNLAEAQKNILSLVPRREDIFVSFRYVELFCLICCAGFFRYLESQVGA